MLNKINQRRLLYSPWFHSFPSPTPAPFRLCSSRTSLFTFTSPPLAAAAINSASKRDNWNFIITKLGLYLFAIPQKRFARMSLSNWIPTLECYTPRFFLIYLIITIYNPLNISFLFYPCLQSLRSSFSCRHTTSLLLRTASSMAGPFKKKAPMAGLAPTAPANTCSSSESSRRSCSCSSASVPQRASWSSSAKGPRSRICRDSASSRAAGA